MNQTYEDLTVDWFKQYYGMTESELHRIHGIVPSASKQKMHLLSRAILGFQRERAIQFEHSGIELKTICLEANGTPMESMSFRQIRYSEIVLEEWETSTWNQILTTRFFFVVFELDQRSEFRLKKVMFWSMPAADLSTAKDFWMDTKRKIVRDDYSNFIKESDDRICHVRPKARDSKDLMETPTGRMEKKKCYWLNSKYIESIVSDSGPKRKAVRVLKRVPKRA